MFGIGWSEFLFIGILALLILGPEKLPGAAKQLGKWVRELRNVSSSLRSEFQDGVGDDWNTMTSAPWDDLAGPYSHLSDPEEGFGAAIPNKEQQPSTDA